MRVAESANLELFGEPPTYSDDGRKLSIEERFALFHRRHPQLYRRMRTIAIRLRRSGLPRCSIDFIYHRLRWLEYKRTGAEPFMRLNDHFTSLYARKLMADVPELADFFELRERRSVHSTEDSHVPAA